MHDPLTEAFCSRRPRLHAQLQKAFPGASKADVEDALSDAYLALHGRQYDNPDWGGLLYRVAWRQLRHHWRHHRRFPTGEIPEGWGAPAGQAFALDLARWGRHLNLVLAEHPEVYRPALRRAIEEKVLTGETDTQLARRHRLHRERFNRAWHDLRRRFAG